MELYKTTEKERNEKVGDAQAPQINKFSSCYTFVKVVKAFKTLTGSRGAPYLAHIILQVTHNNSTGSQ